MLYFILIQKNIKVETLFTITIGQKIQDGKKPKHDTYK